MIRLLRFILMVVVILGLAGFEKPVTQPAISTTDFQSINWENLLANSEVPVYGYQIIRTYPHDTKTFTEGLEVNDGFLYESNGLYQKSFLRRIDKNTGKVLLERKVPSQYFAEGITVFKNNIYQLTYKSNIGFIYNKTNFHLEKEFQLSSQGWGLTHDENELIMTNGSAALVFLNPATLTISHFIIAHYKQQNIADLNDLQYINGKIYANIFQTNIIAIISPVDGAIEGWINLEGITPQSNRLNPYCLATRCLLNGIAYDKEHDEILVTGKNWPYIYAINSVERNGLNRNTPPV